MNHRNIILVGPMGAGKTTVGRHIATELDLDFYDIDQSLELRTGAHVSLIFEIEGEQGFRRRESEMLAEVAAKKQVLIATGGGSVLNEENRKCMRQNGFVIYLRISVERQLARLSRDKTRPLLQTPDRQVRLRKMAEVRDPIYSELADLVINSDNRSVMSTSRHVLNCIKGNQRYS